MGGPYRQPYGDALGFANHFQFSNAPVASGTAGLFTSGDTTPDVTVGQFFIANNTSATVISYFDMLGYSYKAADYSGKRITVMVVDNGSTSFANAGQIYMTGTGSATIGTNPAFYEFVQFNSAWYQTGVSQINRSQEQLTFTLGSASSINVDGTRFLRVTGTAATSYIIAFSGGQIGQTVIVNAAGTSGVNHYVTDNGNIAIAGTGDYCLNVSGTYQFTKIAANRWSMLHIGTTGIADV